MIEPVLLTLAEAAARLDPPISLRTLQAVVRVAQLAHVDKVPAPRRHARRFDSAALDRLHAAWVRGEISTTRITTDDLAPGDPCAIFTPAEPCPQPRPTPHDGRGCGTSEG